MSDIWDIGPHVLAQLQDAVVCTDLELNVVYWNDAAEQIFQWPRAEILGRSVLRRLPVETHADVSTIMEEVCRRASATTAEWEDYRRDGSRLWINWRSQPIADGSGRVVGVVSIGTDVTTRRAAEQRRAELETQLRRIQRMETVGMLASGIAHDFNNILGVILMRAEIGLADPTTGPKGHASLQDIRGASLRAKNLVKRVLNFSRRDEIARRLVDLPKLLGEVMTLTHSTLPSTVEVRIDVPTRCPATFADENRLHQLFINLISNAVAAMPGGGRLSIGLRETALNEPRAMAVGAPGPGPYLAVTVADTGVGMDRATLGRIFEPLFTTKAAGEGTGLGLAIVASVIGDHAGGIEVSSTPGAGSTFTVLLPIADENDVALHTPMPTRPLQRGEGERLLVADPEESMALVTRAALEALGYRVQHVSTIVDFLRELETQRPSYDLILTAPALTGHAAIAERLRSGRSVTLEPPIEIDQLAALIRRSLEGRQA